MRVCTYVVDRKAGGRSSCASPNLAAFFDGLKNAIDLAAVGQNLHQWRSKAYPRGVLNSSHLPGLR